MASATYRGGGYLFGDTNVNLNATPVAKNPLLVACSQFGSTSLAMPSDSQGNTWRLESSKTYSGIQLYVWSTPGTTAITGTVSLTGNATNAVLWSAWELSGVDYETVTNTSQAGGLGNTGPFPAPAAGVGFSVGFSAGNATDVAETWATSQNLNVPPSIYDSALSSNGVLDNGSSTINTLWSSTTTAYVASVTVCLRLKKFRPRGRTVLQASKRAAFR